MDESSELNVVYSRRHPVSEAEPRSQRLSVSKKDDTDGSHAYTTSTELVDGQHRAQADLVPVAEKHHLGYLSTT